MTSGLACGGAVANDTPRPANDLTDSEAQPSSSDSSLQPSSLPDGSVPHPPVNPAATTETGAAVPDADVGPLCDGTPFRRADCPCAPEGATICCAGGSCGGAGTGFQCIGGRWSAFVDGPCWSQFPEASACGVVETTSTLPHVRIVFRAPTCTFTLAEAAAGIVIPYDLVVEQDVPGFVPAHPYAYGPTAANLEIAEKLSGGGQNYCLCDKGLPRFACPGTTDGGALAYNAPCVPTTIPAGTYHLQFAWDGRNWTGPSDTGNPKGPPFPPGDYVLTIATTPGALGDGGSYAATAKFVVRLLR